MRLGGVQKFTLLDYPGKVAATVFTVGCSFRCSFCHNPELVLPKLFPKQNDLEKEFFALLEKRKGKLDGVCITGGEPTIQPDIIEFIEKIKSLGYLVKLDTNGTQPDVLERVLSKGIVDFVAMDIKSSPEKYESMVGLTPNIKKIKKSISLIMQSGVDYEFRTTVVPGLHSEQDFEKIAKWIKGAKAYYLQKYREIKILDPKLKKKTNGKEIDLKKLKAKLEPFFGKVGIRGED